jgi:spore germination protein
MADLEVKTTMSPLQLAIIIFMVAIAINNAIVRSTVADAGQAAWLSLLAGGALYLGVALLIVKLGDLFPGRTFVQYMPQIWGRWPGTGIVYFYLLFILLMTFVILHGFSREVAFFLFRRTPYEVLEASLLAACVYCALQDWGTVLQVVQVVLYTGMSLWAGFMLVAIPSTQVVHFLPLWPDSAMGVVWGAYHAWQMFFGYELILFLLPLVYRGNTRVGAAVTGAFAALVAVFLLMVMLPIGALTVQGVINSPFPVLAMIRGMEVPGTFVERLDTYYVMYWMQLFFAAFSVFLHIMSKVLAQCHGHADHRPWVLALAPLMFIGGDALHSNRLYEAVGAAANMLGLAFSLAVVPASYALARWRRHKAAPTGSDTDG